jgi:UDP-N-acetylglucosamine 3-dehydrogenase
MSSRMPLRGVVVGYGVMGRNHARILRAMPRAEVELAAIVDPSPATRTAAADARMDCPIYESLTAALSAQELHFACIATPVRFLAPLASEALRANLDVLVEKPMASSTSEAQSLVEEAASSGRILMPGLVERSNPAVIALKGKLAAGDVGRIVQMHARRLSPFPNRTGMSGAILDLATHDIDVMRFVSGLEFERVYAETADGLGAGGEDLVCATLRLADTTTALIEANWITPTKVRQLSITGERGMFVVDYLTQGLTFFRHPTDPTTWEPLAGMRGGGEGDMIRFALHRQEPLLAEWNGFFAGVRGTGPLPATASDALATLATADAIKRSAKLGQPVEPGPSRARDAVS